MKHSQPLFSYKISSDTKRDRDYSERDDRYRGRDRDYSERDDRYRGRDRDYSERDDREERDRDYSKIDDRYRERDRDYSERDDREERDRGRDRGRKKSSGGFNSYRQKDNRFLHKILNAFKGDEIPLISIKPELTKNYILNLAKENIKHLSTKNPDTEAIKNIQTSCYILSHPEYSLQRGLVVEYLLETLFTPNFLLKDDYSIDENRLAIVSKDGSNFASFLLNSSNMGSSLFQKFLSKKNFSSDQVHDKEIKQKILESMIFSIPSDREDPNHSDRKILNINSIIVLKMH